jgi:HEAT repeat protein
MANGELSVTLVEHAAAPSVHRLAEAIETVLELAQRLELPPEVVSRLAANFEHEPQWRVRLRELELLATNHPNHPATIAAMRHGLRDKHAAVQLHAAATLGEEGRDTLLAVATGDVDDGYSARAIELLGERLPAKLALSLLHQALNAGRATTANASLRALGRVKSAEAGELLSKVLASESGSLAQAAAHALGERGASDGEPALLAALQRGEPGLLIPVAEALGHCGSVHAVLPLRELAEVASPELRRAAEKSVAMIQSRLIGSSPGQLSIADARSGELSLADDDPRGRVSLTVDPPRTGSERRAGE